MTFNKPEEFYDAPPANYSGYWEFDCLNDCFPGRVTITDLDGIIERRGQFLVFETKNDNVPLPKGQQILLDQLLKLGVFTVVIIWGKPGVTALQRVTRYHRNTEKEVEPTIEALKELCRKWWDWADNGGGKR